MLRRRMTQILLHIEFFDSALESFIGLLEKSTIAKVLRTIDLLETFGNRLGLPHSKKIERDIFELRIRGRQEVRLFYAFYRQEIILLHGFVKKSQRIPQKEIEVARHKLQSLDTK